MAVRVGLTGGLGSGKSTVAAMLKGLGAHVLSADEIARELMQPGNAVYDAIVKKFGPGVLHADKTLDRAGLARMAFGEGRLEELNAIVHPATIAEQERRVSGILAREPVAVVVVESALIFETAHAPGWRNRFDFLVLVTAPEATKIARFITRSGGEDKAALAAEARRRLAHVIPDEVKAAQMDAVIHNDGTLDQLQQQVTELWARLISGKR